MVRSLSSRASGGRTDRCSGPDSPAIQALREELVCPGIATVSVPLLLDVDETDPMNGPFSALEFSAALESCNVRSAPGLAGIGYGVLRGMSERARGFVLSLFSRMFVESRFPHSWRETLVTFLPKPGSTKFRPILLTSTLWKTFERMVQKLHVSQSVLSTRPFWDNLWRLPFIGLECLWLMIRTDCFAYCLLLCYFCALFLEGELLI